MSGAVEPPRLLVLAAGAWFIGALLLGLGARVPDSLTLGSLFPAVRICLVACVAGAIVGWPLLRFSVAPPARCAASTLLELATMIALLQAVLWPMRLATPWPIERTLLIDFMACSQLVGASGIVAIGSSSSSPIARGLAMIAILGVACGIGAGWGLPAGIPGILDAMDSTASMPTTHEWALAVGGLIATLCIAIIGLTIAYLASGGCPRAGRSIA